MKIIDTHCHINIREFKDDAHDVIQRALDKGIYLIMPGTQNTTSERAIEYAHQYEGVWAAVGLHPTQLFDVKARNGKQEYYSRAENFDYGYYKKLASDSNVVAIGEVGLDYYHIPDDINVEDLRSKQIDVLTEQFSLAKELDLPLIIHTRNGKNDFDSFGDVLDIINDTGYNNCVLHSFGGSLEQAQAFIEAGCMLSFTGIVTFKNATDIHHIIREISLNSIMLETDSPYLSPEPHRGTRNEPENIVYVAERVAELKQISIEEVISQTTKNAVEFFSLDESKF